MQKAIKRIVDIFISALALVILFPVFLLIAAAIKMTSPGPVLFIQERVGKDGVPFRMYKFRSMRKGSEKLTHGRYITSDDEHITRLGKFLRRWALDELPQLANVLKGDMSIVGPRPTLAYQVVKYNDYQRRRLNVKPGITGWAQVNGRNMLSWPERMDYDIWYADNWKFLLDMKIILKTAGALLKREFSFAAEGSEVKITENDHESE